MSQINKPNTYFNTLTWTGNGSSTRSITGVGFQPDLTWKKERNASFSIGHMLYDSVRGLGVNKHLDSSTTFVEGSGNDEDYGYFTSFNSDGFSVSNGSVGSDYVNNSSYNYVAWNWKAGGTGASNTDGSITSTVSASTTSGFSIVSWTGNQTAGASCGHGLGVAPSMIIKRRRNGDGADYWYVYHKSLGSSNSIYLNTTDASGASGAWNSQNPTSTVFYHGSSIRENGGNMIAYCFAEKKGFSKFGSYTGNGSANGTFVYTGFKPAFLIVKRTSTAENWWIHDNKRVGYNVSGTPLKANSSDAEIASGNESSYGIDLLSNGFKVRTSEGSVNTSGGTYIYMAFAQNPLVGTNNIPACAR